MPNVFQVEGNLIPANVIAVNTKTTIMLHRSMIDVNLQFLGEVLKGKDEAGSVVFKGCINASNEIDDVLSFTQKIQDLINDPAIKDLNLLGYVNLTNNADSEVFKLLVGGGKCSISKGVMNWTEMSDLKG